MNELLPLIAASILGIATFILINMIRLQKQYKNANEKFSVKKYWESDYLVVVFSILLACLWLLIKDEFFGRFPKWDVMPLIFTWMINANSTWLVQVVISKFVTTAKGVLNEKIDEKTDIADGKKPDPKKDGGL